MLFKACYGLIFFGVPNLGLRHEQLRTMVGSQPSQKLIDDLVVDKESEASPLLIELGKRFYKCCEDQELRIVSFYEREIGHTVEVGRELLVNANK